MYISSIRIKSFRCIKESLVEFQPGINVLIGENNSGKTTVLRALGYLFDRKGRTRPTVSDFHRGSIDLDQPPSIQITVTIRSSGESDTLEDRAVVATWLTKLDPPWEACLTYDFALPEQDALEFKSAVGPNPTADRYWAVVDEYNLKYVARVLGGNPESQVKADSDALAKFDYQFLDALRDAESQMFRGSAPLLKRMLIGALDQAKTDDEKAVLRKAFKDGSGRLLDNLIQRVDKGKLLALAKSTGAEDGGVPDLSGTLEEGDLLSALNLVIKRNDITVPASHNGLGYNNLLYMSLVMASIELDASTERRGQNATVFPMLIIEEPEAHLHPTQQYKLLKYIKERLQQGAKCRQVFLSTHSTHITSAVELDTIVWLATTNTVENIAVGYPGRCFAADTEGTKSKHYVERFLDATKSNMLFAKGVLLVEGITEQLTLPSLAGYLDVSLEESHVVTVAVSGVNFKHFLPLFGGTSCPTARRHAISRRIACVIDADPSRMLKATNGRHKKCWPYQIGQNNDKYQYKPTSSAVARLEEDCASHAGNIQVFHGVKTLEYDLAIANPSCSLLVTSACAYEAELIALMNDPSVSQPDLEERLGEETIQTLAGLPVANAEQTKARVATHYLISLENAKGEHAFELSHSLRANLELKSDVRLPVVVPAYVEQAIRWVCPSRAE